jgi:hypothetical protein
MVLPRKKHLRNTRFGNFHPHLPVAPDIDANEPGALSARHNLPCFPGPCPEAGTHFAHRVVMELRFYWRLRNVLLIGEYSRLGKCAHVKRG